MGLSFGKILLLLLIAAAVWLGIIVYRRSQRRRELAESAATKPVGAVETVECTVCGIYRPRVGTPACSRSDCPIASR